MDMQLVEQVRRFNRTITERIGVLNDHFLGRNHPLGEARLLWEIGEQGREVRELRRRLGLDSAYVSRLLRSLEGQHLVSVRTSRMLTIGSKNESEPDTRGEAQLTRRARKC